MTGESVRHSDDRQASADDTPRSEPNRPTRLVWTQFQLRDAFWVVIIVALALGWWRQTQYEPPNDAKAMIIDGVQHIEGPLTIRYSQRTSPTGTSSSTIREVSSLDIHPNFIVVTDRQGGRVFSNDGLIFFNWHLEDPAPTSTTRGH